MKLLILLICCLGAIATDQQADSTEVQSSNKLSATKSSLNTIPSAPAQKATLVQQSHQQYVPQYVVQKPVAVLPSQATQQQQHQQQHHQQQQQQQLHHHHQAQQQPAAMYIIAQPSGQSGTQGALFQQAVQQLLSYYNNNPQARYQLLQQQGGIPQGGIPQGGIPHGAIPQSAVTHQAPQQTYHHQPQMPSGALHVIPSPQLENSNTPHLSSAPSAAALTQHPVSNNAQSQPQPIYAIPASSQYTLSQFSPSVLAQFTGQLQAQHQQSAPVPVPVQIPQHQHLFTQSPQPEFGSQFISQIPAHFGSQFASHLPPQYAIAPQFPSAYHPQLQVQIGAPQQQQYSLKQNTASNSNEYLAQIAQSAAQSTQSDKNTQPASSNYNAVYKTAYIKG